MSDQHDQDIKAFSEPLKQIEPPADLRQNNRAAIARALEQHETGPIKRLGWWKQRVSIPVPIAAAILLVIGLQVLFQVRSVMQSQHQPVSTAQEITQANEFITEKEESFEIQYQQKAVYVAGLGTIYRAEIYHFEEI